MARFTGAEGSGSGAPGPQGPQGPAGEDAVLPQDLGTTDSPTFSKITLTSNGATDNITIGDDVILGDGNIANHVVIIGQQDATQGGIVLGSNETESISTDSTNLSLTSNNDIVLNPGSTYAYIGTPQLDGSNRIAKMSDITGVSNGIVFLGDYVSGNGYVANIAVVRGSDGNLYIAKDSGGLQDPVGNTAQWDIFSDNSTTSGGDLVIPTSIKDENNEDFITITRTNTGTARIDAPQDDLSLRSAADITLFAGTDGPGHVYIGWGDAEYTPDSPNRVATIGDIQAESNHGDFQFTAGTATVNDNEALILQAKTPTAVKSQLFLNPYGVAKLEAFDNPNVTTFSAANPDWDSATWSVEPGIGSVIQFVNAPNIINWVNSLTTSVYDASLIINGVAAGTVNGLSYGSTDVTLYINNTVPTEDPTVNELGFVFVISSFIDINYDNGSLDIEAKNMDIDIKSDDDVYITAGGDDLFLRANDDIRFTSSYNNPGEAVYDWRMDSEGEFHLPGQGLIWNPSGTSGDGYGNDTIHLVPSDSDNETEQRIIIDPTAPNHIHIRAGGLQDYSNVELILGGERAGVRVSDGTGTTVVQSKQEDYSWSYQNVGEGGNVYVVATADAEPDYGDFTVINGSKYVITNVTRDQQNGTTSYETTPGIGFAPFENYTFIRDRGNHAWTFNRQGYLSGPTETGSLRVTGIINDDGNLDVQADQNLILSGGETNGEYLHDSSNPNNQIATIGDITTAVGVGGNGEVTRWSPNFTATGLAFTGTDATYPTYNSHYVKNGRMVSFWIEINLATVTNFGTGQYITALPFAPLTGTMNHFQAWANVDPTLNPDIAGHVVLQADHLANTTALDLHYLKQAGGANSPLMEAMFTQDAPAELTTSTKIYINGTYITAE